MKKPSLIFLLLLASVFALAQTDFEIRGTISGKYRDSIYLFFENDLAHKDSIAAPIEHGKFRFKLRAQLPILCRIHFSFNSNVKEFYVDGPVTELMLTSRIVEDDGNARAEINITDIKGSLLEDDKRAYYSWLEKNAKPGPDHTAADVAYPQLTGYVAANPKSKLSAYLIAGGIHMIGNSFVVVEPPPFNYTWTRRLSTRLDSSVMNSFEGENLKKLLAYLLEHRNRDSGKVFLDAILMDSSGREISTANLFGKYVLVDFWASWCGPCRALNPELKRIYSKYGKKGFDIVGISLDANRSDWINAVQQDRLPWRQFLDEKAFNGQLANYYDIKAIPLKVLLDPSGRVIAFDPSLYDLEKFLEVF